MNSSFEIVTTSTRGSPLASLRNARKARRVRSWKVDHATGRMTRPLRHNGEPYSGINVLSLWASSNLQGFAAPFWMTFRQAIELKAHVRKGEKGSPVVYASALTCRATDAQTGDEVERAVRFLKGYTVFNVEQIEGLWPRFYAWPEQPPGDSPHRIDRAHQFFAATGAVVSHGGSQAYYRPSTDAIVMPPLEAFGDAQSY
jgi:antirestriction protein ArdC